MRFLILSSIAENYLRHDYMPVGEQWLEIERFRLTNLS
jgi:hypothetical protein